VLQNQKHNLWLESHNRSIVGFKRISKEKQVFCLFNYSPEPQNLTFYAFHSIKNEVKKLYNLYDESYTVIGKDHEFLSFKPYQFYVFLTEKK